MDRKWLDSTAAVVKTHLFGTRASIETIPETRRVCEARSQTGPSQWTLFSPEAHEVPMRKDGENGEWLINGAP